MGVAAGPLVAGAASVGGVLPLADDGVGPDHIAADSRCCT